MEIATNPTTEPIDTRARSPQAKQLTKGEHNPTHQQAVGLESYLSTALQPEQDPIFPIASLYTNLLTSHPRADRRSKKSTISQQLEQKPHYRKLIRMRKQKVMFQRKRQDKTPEKQLNEVEIGNLPEKEYRIMIVKMIWDLGKIMERMQEMFTKDLQELKNKHR